VNRRLVVFLLAVVAIVTGVNVVCKAEPKSLLTPHVQEAILNGAAPLVGQLPATQTMHFDVVLALSHPDELDNFLKELYDPTSPSYRHFVTVPEFTERFGPSQKDYDAVVRFAKANGFKIISGSRDAMDIRLQGKVGDIEKALHVTMGVYQHPTENRTYYSPDREPTIDLPFQLWHVSGLDNYSIPHPMLKKRDVQSQAQPEATTGSCPQQSFCGSDMRAAYYGSGPLNGAGQNVGLLEYLGYDIADVNTYYTNAGQTRSVAVVGISVDGTNVLCASPCDDTEQTLDITQAAGMAPNLGTIYVYVGSTDTALLSAMSTDTPLPAQLSASWTWTPSPAADNPYFQKMAAQGQTYFTASGDSGFYTGSALWPANSQYVESVGGTDLVTSGAGGPWASETAWADGGGGWGTNTPIPAWQQLPGVVTTANKGSTQFRNVPDFSANANFTFYVCADQNGCTANVYGGTSFAAPMWAGFMAMVNQQALAGGNPILGFINPAVYNLGLGSGYDTAFHDIVSGSNGLPTTTGYDLATGWGSPNGAGLIDALVPNTPGFTISDSPNALTLVQGASGTSTLTVTDLDGFSGSVNFSISSLPSGVTAAFSPNPATSTSTLTLTASATAALGTANLTITGKSGSITQTLPFTLTVNGPDYSLTATPSKLTQAPGTSGTSTIKVVPTNGFTGGVTLAASGVPSGVTAAFSPNPTTSTSTLTLTLGSSVGTGSHVITITGTSGSLSHTTKVTLVVKGAKVKLAPTSLTFPKTKVGSTSSLKTVTLTNTGNATLNISTIAVSGDFFQKVTTGACVNGSAILAGKTCTIKIQFKPTATGVRTGNVTINDNALGSPQTVALSGTGS
jgi:subtilase family serine protease